MKKSTRKIARRTRGRDTGPTNPADSGNDVIYAGEGKDQVWAGAGNDTIAGEAGNDILFGGTGNDNLFGDASYLDAALHGNDYIDGGDGNDTIYVGADGLFGREKCEAANDETTQVWRMAT